MTIRTRFAPSPSGYLHLGGARTALFAWAWARKNGGEFILRIEDTDAARSCRQHSDAIICAMQWLRLDFDGAPQFQSHNIEYHRQIAADLLHSNAAYEDQGALRIRTPTDGEVFFDDRVGGRLAVQNKELEDPVILRGDKTPTYVFASAVDDIKDRISDVIRGDDHVRNTHKQLHIYAALNKTPPRFAHLPMILSADGERLSKRHAAVDVMQYRRDGFLSAALINYLARLSWSCGDAEVFDAAFLTRQFDFAAVQKSPARFDIKKLRWLSGEHLRGLSAEEVRIAADLSHLSAAASGLILPRSETFADVREHANYLYHRPAPPAALLTKHINEQNRAAIIDLSARLIGLLEWNTAAIKKEIKETAAAHQLKFPQLGMPLRVLLTAREQSPDIAEVAEILGREETAARMEIGD